MSKEIPTTKGQEEWNEFDKISVNGAKLGISLRRDHSNIWLSESVVKDDVELVFNELVNEGTLKLPQAGDDAGSWGKIFWKTTDPMSVEEIVEKLRQKGLDVKKIE